MNEDEILALMEGAEPDVRIGFILTEEGRMWSEEGLRAATDWVNEKYPPEGRTPADGILWISGYRINDPDFLAKLLEARPDAYVILSMSPNSIVLPNDDGLAGNEYAGALRLLAGESENGSTSWGILKTAVEKYGPGADTP